jgi:CHASE2 domain-containing sensor protein
VKIFLISISAISIVLALLFMWWRDFNTAFIIAIVGIVAWFWNYRMDMKKIALAADAERERQAEQNEEE